FTGPLWIIFLDNAQDREELLGDVVIPINTELLLAKKTQNGIYLEEMFNIENKSKKILNYFGVWSEQSGLNVTNNQLYERRKNFNGMKFQANPPMTNVMENGPVISIDGFVGEVWRDLENSLNFTTVYHIPMIQTENNTLVDGKWQGMFDEVRNSISLLGIDSITMTGERAQKVDFAMSLLSTK
ncbi:hypothetical protein L9F63_027794, partial [Diploptera punctata]